MKNYAKLLRIKQWVKNLFVFLPLIFSGNIFHFGLLLKSILAFVIFSLVSGAVYILNDYMDMEADRNHPEKKSRPLASGAVPVSSALFLFAGIIVVVLCLIVCSWYHWHVDMLSFSVVVGAYFILNICYSIKLKHIAIIDIFILAMGFVLRVLSGGYITGIFVSQWTILLSFTLALVLAIGKRREELISVRAGNGKNREALSGYNIQLIDIALAISCTLAMICYLMFTLSPETQEKFHSRVFYTFIFVFFGFMRYLQQTMVYNKAGSPTKIIYHDRYMQATLILWLTVFLLQIYVK